MNRLGKQPQISRRGFIRGAALLGSGLVLSACRPESSNQSQDQIIPLVYQDWRTEWFPPMAQAMLDQFHQDHENIRVFYTPDPEDFLDQMEQDFRTGTAPDVFQGCCTHFPAWAQQGYTLDLAPYLDQYVDSATIRDWDRAQLGAMHLPNGNRFGVPKYHGALGLYYNKDLFDKYGVDYPDGTWDHDDYSQAMQLLADDRDGDGEVDQWGSAIDVSWDRIQVHVNGWGGHFVDPNDPTVSRMSEEPALAAFDWLHEHIQERQVMATSFDLQNLPINEGFIQGRTAMVESGSWALRNILSSATFRVGVAPFPKGPARQVTIATTDGFGIFAGTQYPEAAWELVEFLISPAYGRAMARANLLQPARRSLVQDWVGFVREAFPDRAGQIDVAAFAEGHRQDYSVTAEIFADMDIARELAYQAWDEILVLGERPVSDLVEVSRRITEAQDSNTEVG